jgi:hypothetical protein
MVASIPLRQMADVEPIFTEPDPSKPRGGAPQFPPTSAARALAAEGPENHIVQDGRGAAKLRPSRLSALSSPLPKLRVAATLILRLSRWIDDQMHGRWRKLLILLSLLCGVVAPLVDYYLLGERVSTFRNIASGVILLAIAVFATAKLDKLRDDGGRWSLTVAWQSVQTRARLIAEDITEFGSSPRYLKLFIAGQLVGIAGLAGLTWANSVSVVRVVLGIVDTPSDLRTWSGVAVFVAALLLQSALRRAPKSPIGNQGKAVAAATHLPAIVDLSDPLPFSFSGGGTPVHAVLTALSLWRSRPWPTEAGYQAALERHFQRRLPRSRVQREKWMGQTRASGIADIIIDDLVLIEVKRGFAKASADRAKGQLDGYVQTWPGKPILLVIFDAPKESVFDSVATARLVELHKCHAIVTVRMPLRR